MTCAMTTCWDVRLPTRQGLSCLITHTASVRLKAISMRQAERSTGLQEGHFAADQQAMGAAAERTQSRMAGHHRMS